MSVADFLFYSQNCWKSHKLISSVFYVKCRDSCQNNKVTAADWIFPESITANFLSQRFQMTTQTLSFLNKILPSRSHQDCVYVKDTDVFIQGLVTLLHLYNVEHLLGVSTASALMSMMYNLLHAQSILLLICFLPTIWRLFALSHRHETLSVFFSLGHMACVGVCV